MRKQLFNFTKENSSQDIYNNLSKNEKEILNDFKDYIQVGASTERSGEAVREILRFKEMIGKHFNKIDLKDLTYFLKEIKQGEFADHSKNKIKGFVHRFLKWKFKRKADERFNDFEILEYNRGAVRKEPIKEVVTQQEIEKIMKTETSLFWKTFFITQYEGALRTLETRRAEWSHLGKEDDDGIIFLKVINKKNKMANEKEREIPLKKAVYYLNELKKEQKEQGIETKWVFPSPRDPKNFVSKNVNTWFSKLTKKALKRSITNYMLRHTRGTELEKLVREGKMSKTTAIEIMGHSEEMFDKVYTHMNKEAIRKIIKEQTFQLEYMPPEKKKEMKEEIESLKSQLKKFEKFEEETRKNMKKIPMDYLKKAMIEMEETLSKNMKKALEKERKNIKGK